MTALIDAEKQGRFDAGVRAASLERLKRLPAAQAPPIPETAASPPAVPAKGTAAVP
jgi:hypothetical protein